MVEYQVEGEALPKVGDRSVVVDSTGSGVAVIEVTQVRIERLADVDLAHAVDEGEGFNSVIQWRVDHQAYWESSEMRAAMGDPDFTVADESMLVLERFKVIARRPSKIAEPKTLSHRTVGTANPIAATIKFTARASTVGNKIF